MIEMPRRSAPFSMREILCAWISHEVTLPSFFISIASAKLLPPGAAQVSRTRIPGLTPAAIAASFADASCT